MSGSEQGASRTNVTQAAAADDGKARKRYSRPEVVEWGAIEDVTQGGTSGTSDGNLTGSGGT